MQTSCILLKSKCHSNKVIKADLEAVGPSALRSVTSLGKSPISTVQYCYFSLHLVDWDERPSLTFWGRQNSGLYPKPSGNITSHVANSWQRVRAGFRAYLGLSRIYLKFVLDPCKKNPSICERKEC